MKRFWSKVEKTNDCWNWLGGIRGKAGYGAFKLNGRTISTHRFSWILHFGEIPKKMCVCHHCDNRLCVRPHHLFLGTRKDNNRDGFKKGRIIPPKGEKNGTHKLTSEKVREIRKTYKMGKLGFGFETLSKRYGVSNSNIERIIKRKTWKHI